jgi:methylthioxylose transferase
MSNVPRPSAATDSPPGHASAERLSSRALWDWLGAGSLVSLLVCYAIATQWLVLGSSEGGWVYGYVATFSPHTLMVAAAGTALSAAFLFGLRPETSRRDWLAVLAWIVLALGLQALIRSVTPFSFERLFASDGANAFYGVTEHFRAGAVLRDFDRVRALWPLHAQSNMPGKLMLVYALRNLSRDPAVLAWLAVAVSNLGAALMYLLVRELFGDRRIAMYSAVLYLVMPAKLYFFPLLNSVTPVIVLACAVLVLRWLRTGKAAYAAALGAATFGLVFYEPLPLVTGLLFALFVLRAFRLGQITPLQVLTHVCVGLAAWLTTYVAMRLLFGFDLVSAFRQIGEHAVRFNADAGRPYSIWIWANLREFLFGIGICQAILFWAALVDGFRSTESWRDRLTHPMSVLCIGAAAVLLVTDAIGVNRGEVIRLWIFLGCFFQIPAAYVCARLDSRAALLLVLAVTILQATLGTAMIGFIVPA